MLDPLRRIEEDRVRSDAVVADIRRRQEAARIQDSSPVEQHHGHGGWLLLLILAAAILSRRLRKGLGFAALFVLVGAGIAYVVAIIIPSPDTANLAISLGALGLIGAITRFVDEDRHD
jgi:hypothetical protein